MSDIFEEGFNQSLFRQSSPMPQLPSIEVSSTTISNPITQSVPATQTLSGSFADILFANKTSFTDTVQGYRMGLDPADSIFKWVIGSSNATMDFGVTNAGVFTISLPESGSVSNAIFISDPGNNAFPAVDIRRSVGTGVGMNITSSAGSALFLTTSSDTPCLQVISTGSGASVVPLQLENDQATSTNFYEMAELQGTSAPAVSVSQWVANNTSPSGTLTGSAGDICQSSNGKLYVCSGGTSWSQVGGEAGKFSDWRFPDAPNQSGTVSVSATIDSGTTYTPASGKRLYIYSIANSSGANELDLDGKPIVDIPTPVQWQDRSGTNGYYTFGLTNPIIVDAGVVLSAANGNNFEIFGFLVNPRSTDVSIITTLVDDTTKYTVTSGKMFVMLQAYTQDGKTLLCTPNGGSKFTIGKNINDPANGGWLMTTPMFFYAGDVLEGNDATDATIHGYEITI